MKTRNSNIGEREDKGRRMVGEGRERERQTRKRDGEYYASIQRDRKNQNLKMKN